MKFTGHMLHFKESQYERKYLTRYELRNSTPSEYTTADGYQEDKDNSSNNNNTVIINNKLIAKWYS
jgi:hypothetical protein